MEKVSFHLQQTFQLYSLQHHKNMLYAVTTNNKFNDSVLHASGITHKLSSLTEVTAVMSQF